MSFPRLTSINIKGYRPFRDFTAEVGALEVLVGANGSGKSSLFEFLKFLRDSMQGEIPPEIVSGAYGQQIFHSESQPIIEWSINTDLETPTLKRIPINYEGSISGPIGRLSINKEYARSGVQEILNVANGKGKFFNLSDEGEVIEDIPFDIQLRPRGLALRAFNNALEEPLFQLRDYIANWGFYGSLVVAIEKIRRPVVIEQEPILREDCGNLSSVLHYLMTEYRDSFDELQDYLRFVIPGFEALTVKARGGPGEVIAFYRENGVDSELSLSDSSEGVIRLLCWMVLCLYPKPPTLICVDEPDQGVHPRTLTVLAELFKRTSDRTQVILSTHSSYFLKQFGLADIAVMRKEDGEAIFRKPKNSKILQNLLREFGADEIEQLHQSDELESFA